jgi:chromate transport protein ChrA
MNRYRSFAWPAYIVGLTLILTPLADVALEVWPFRWGNAQWRFGAVGLLSNSSMVTAAGILIVLAVAIALEHYRLVDLIGWLSAVLAALVASILGIFALDVIQTRVDVLPAGLQAFTIASITAAAKMLVFLVTLVAFATAALRTVRAKAADRRQRAASLLVASTTRVARRA